MNVSYTLKIMDLFGKKKSETVALIDINSSSVGGAYARISEGERPILLYTHRVPIISSPGNSLSEQMLKALDNLGRVLLETGAPVLHRETGSGQVHSIFASIGSPWQETLVRVKTINEQKPFVFTRAHLQLTNADSPLKEGRIRSGESVVATLLNGYEVAHPFGKKVKRADLVILSSSLDEKVSKEIQEKLKRWYHAHQVTLTAFAPLAYEVYRDVYPHEKDFILLHVGGETTDIAFIKKGLLVDVASLPSGITTIMRAAHKDGALHADGGDVIDPARNTHFSMRVKDAQDAWVKGLTEVLRAFSSRHALARTVFLLTEDNSREYVKRLLNAEELHTLWLSDEPLVILPSLPSHFSAFVAARGEASGDTSLMMLAIDYRKRKEGADLNP